MLVGDGGHWGWRGACGTMIGMWGWEGWGWPSVGGDGVRRGQGDVQGSSVGSWGRVRPLLTVAAVLEFFSEPQKLISSRETGT